MTEPAKPDPTTLRIVFTVLAVLIGVMFVVLIWIVQARAAEEAYCVLWARERTRVELMTEADIDTRTLTPDGIGLRASRWYSRCLLTESDHVALPATPATKTAGWIEDMRTLSLSRVGDAPAEVGWAEACAAEYRTWDEATGTVVREGHGRVRCPCGTVSWC